MTNMAELTEKQREANALLAGPAKHIMLRGGARSGKTFLFCRAIAARGFKAPKSTHIVLRHRFNHLKMSIIEDTFPKVMRICFPGYKYRLNKSDWFHELQNGSRIIYGGLDDKERTEKILGQEHSTIFLNEASQISYHARNMAQTRLAQNSGLKLKEYIDCNPPTMGHWTYKLFFKKIEPRSGATLLNPDEYQTMLINPVDNPNLPPEFLDTLRSLPEKERLRFYEGKYLSGVANALWTYDLLDTCRVAPAQVPPLERIVVAVDPSGCFGEEDERSDEIGITVQGRGVDGSLYNLEDISGHFGPEQWARRVVDAFDRWEADTIVAEKNYGGAMVVSNIRAVRADAPIRVVTASRAKHVRAEPVANLYTQGKAKHLGSFPDMEEQLCNFSSAGYQGHTSPDRADAMIWGATELMIKYQQDTSIGLSQVARNQPEIFLGV